MPYLDAPWPTGESVGDLIAARRWVPETDRDEWMSRGLGLPLREYWETDHEFGRTFLEEVAHLPRTIRDDYLPLLGRDVGSIQRDAFFYMNSLEQLKGDPDDDTADLVVERMRGYGFVSVEWTQDQGGPPPRMSPRPWKKVMEWLFRQIAKAATALRRCAEFLTALLSGGEGISAVAVGVMPPSIGVELSADLFRNEPAWDAVYKFMDNVQAEVRATVFG